MDQYDYFGRYYGKAVFSAFLIKEKLKGRNTRMSNYLVFEEGLRGIVLELLTRPLSKKKSSLRVECHEITDEELKILSDKGELKIPIEGWPRE